MSSSWHSGARSTRRGFPVGWRSTYADPDELYLAVVFANEEAYRRNANSPAMDASYRRVRELMVADPEWHDGGVVFAKP